MSEPRVNQQSAVDTWYLRFLKNLEVGYHRELAWNLIMMGRATASISLDAFKPFPDRYKTEVLKAMLTAIANRDTDLSYSDRELNELLIGARKLGVNWPELDIMERSVRADHKLDEAKKIQIPDTEEGQLALVRRDPHSIQWIPNPSERVKMEAVSYNGYAIQGIKDPSEEIKLAAVERNGAAIECIKNPSDAVKLAAVKSDGSAIYYIRRPTDEMKRAAVESWPLAVGYIRNPSDELQVLAVSTAPYAIDYIKRPSLNAQLTAMKKSATMILRIRKIDTGLWENKRVKVKVLKQMLRWLKGRNQEDAAMMAKHLRANACPWPELDIILKSLKTDKLIKENLRINTASEEEQLAAVKQNGWTIQMIRYPSPEVQLAAVKQDGVVISAINNPWPQMWTDEEVKTSVMKTMLSAIKSGVTSNAAYVLRHLRKIRCPWPELDVIERSIETIKRINEGRFDDEMRRQAREHIERLPFLADSPGDCMYVFSFGYDHGELFDRSLKPSFQPHREKWIRFLLEELKFGDDQDEITNAVDILRNRIGLDWPELAIMERSLNA